MIVCLDMIVCLQFGIFCMTISNDCAFLCLFVGWLVGLFACLFSFVCLFPFDKLWLRY